MAAIYKNHIQMSTTPASVCLSALRKYKELCDFLNTRCFKNNFRCSWAISQFYELLQSHTLPDFSSPSRLVLSMTDIFIIRGFTALVHLIPHRDIRTHWVPYFWSKLKTIGSNCCFSNYVI